MNKLNFRFLDLSEENGKKLALFSLGRINGLYKLFLEEIKNENLIFDIDYNNGYSTLINIYEFLFLKNQTNSQIINFKNEIEKYAIDSEFYSSYQSTILTQLILAYISTLDFYISKNNLLLRDIHYNIEEIINIIESEKFYKKNPEGDYEESEKFIDKKIDINTNIINNFYSKIEGLDYTELQNEIERNIIEF
ncbi:hypothetical protein [Lacinutrix salivirga]